MANVNGSDNDDTVTIVEPYYGDDTANVGKGHDYVEARAGNDTVVGEDGIGEINK